MKRNFLHGAVIKLTREDTPKTIEQNFKQMKEAGFDTVVVWPAAFWWEEKKEGYPFNTGKTVLALAQKIGLGVIMELAGQLPMMEYIPDFQMKDEYYAVDENLHKRLTPSSFGYLNYFHPEVNALICEHYEKAALAYREYPSLIGYDVFNETMFFSFDEYTMEEFRIWLHKKYGSIDKLNDVWERTYSDFSQVSYAPWMWMSVMPMADIAAFRKEATGIYLKKWCDAIRRVDSEHPLIADNIGSMITNGTWVYERPQDDYVLKDAVDEIGISFYPKQEKSCSAPHTRWNTFDAFYSASGGDGFYVSEMQTHVKALFNPTTCVRPYELKLWCTEALAAGAKGLIYWMWRPFNKGLQTAGRGLVDYKNRSTPRLELATELSGLFESVGALTPLASNVGILFDKTSHDFQVCYTKCYDAVDQNIYLKSLCGAYEAMWRAGVRCDIVRLSDIENYKMLILSNTVVIGKESARVLLEYVKRGGVIVCDGKIGITDELSMMNDMLPGGEFNAAMGCEYLDCDYEGLDFVYGDKEYRGFYGRELLGVTDGEVVATFTDGNPAIIEKSFGKGKVITLATYMWYSQSKGESGAQTFASTLAERFDLRHVIASEPLHVRISENEDTCFAFVFNYSDTVVSGEVKGYGFDNAVVVPANDVVILKREKK